MTKKKKEEKPKKKTWARGKPSKYKPEYCEQLIEHMKKGYSYQTFAALIEVNLDTLYHWQKIHSEWLKAKEIAFLHCQMHWELIGMQQAKGTLQGSSASWIFNMKNRFKWTDRQEIELGDKAEKTFTLNYKLEK